MSSRNTGSPVNAVISWMTDDLDQHLQRPCLEASLCISVFEYVYLRKELLIWRGHKVYGTLRLWQRSTRGMREQSTALWRRYTYTRGEPWIKQQKQVQIKQTHVPIYNSRDRLCRGVWPHSCLISPREISGGSSIKKIHLQFQPEIYFYTIIIC